MGNRLRMRARLRWTLRRWSYLLRPRVPGVLDELYSSETLRGSALAVVVGMLAGVSAVGFRLAIEAISDVLFGEGERLLSFMGSSYIVLIPAFGGLVAGVVIYLVAREARGSDVAGVIEGVVNHGGGISPRVAVTRATASAMTIGSGGSTGLYGPVVHIGSFIGSFMGQRLGLTAEWVRTLVACGAAGGISATFNAPIAGVFFSLEVILGRFTPRHFSFVVLSSVVADTIHQTILGTSAFLTAPQYQIVSLWELPLYAGLGIVCAVVATVFVQALARTDTVFAALRLPSFLKPALGGLGVGLIGLYSTAVFGLGHETVNQALASEVVVGTAAVLVVLKIVATSLTLGSGGSGGVIAPSLFFGAMLGAVFGHTVHDAFPNATAQAGAYSLVGMAAVFAGVVHAPITAILIVFEMTRDYRMMLPLMVAVVISTLIAQRLSKESIFFQALRRRGVQIGQRDQTDILGTVPVSAVMTRDFPTVKDAMTLREVAELLEESDQHGFPVLDDTGSLYGIITLTDVENAINQGEAANTLVRSIATRSVVTTYPDSSIHETMVKLGARDVGRIPVVSRSDPKKLVGVLRRHDVVRAYTWALGQQQTQETPQPSLNGRRNRRARKKKARVSS
jgi:CIC family chloride channel protein